MLVSRDEALEALLAGKTIRAPHWALNSRRHPKKLVFVPGREIEASFGPMVNAIGEGTKFTTRDHVDAIFEVDGKLECVVNWIDLQDLRRQAHDHQWIVE